MKIHTPGVLKRARDLEVGELAHLVFSSKQALALVIANEGNGLEIILLNGSQVSTPIATYIGKTDHPVLSYGRDWHFAGEEPIFETNAKAPYTNASGTCTLTTEGHVLYVLSTEGNYTLFNIDKNEHSDGSGHYDPLFKIWSIWIDDESTERHGRKILAKFRLEDLKV